MKEEKKMKANAQEPITNQPKGENEDQKINSSFDRATLMNDDEYDGGSNIINSSQADLKEDKNYYYEDSNNIKQTDLKNEKANKNDINTGQTPISKYESIQDEVTKSSSSSFQKTSDDKSALLAGELRQGNEDKDKTQQAENAQGLNPHKIKNIKMLKNDFLDLGHENQMDTSGELHNLMVNDSNFINFKSRRGKSSINE